MDIRDSVQLQSLASSARLIYIVIRFASSNSEGIKETKQSLSSDDLYSIKKGGRILTNIQTQRDFDTDTRLFLVATWTHLPNWLQRTPVWHWQGKSPISGVYKWRTAVFEAFAKIGELSGGTFKLVDPDFLATDKNTVAISRTRATQR